MSRTFPENQYNLGGKHPPLAKSAHEEHPGVKCNIFEASEGSGTNNPNVNNTYPGGYFSRGARSSAK